MVNPSFPRVLWLVTARSGSKGLPNKNARPLAGLPLLVYRILGAQQTKVPHQVWISTDSQAYADLAAANGALVPFIRPADLASDTARSVDVVIHAMRWAEQQGHHFDALGLLEPTSPFTKPAWLDDAVKRLFSDPVADGIVAVRSVHPSSFYVQPKGRYLSDVAKRIQATGSLRRQEELEEVTPSGNFYISKWERLKESMSLYTEATLMYHVPDPYGLEIDRPLDWAWAEFLLKQELIERHDFGVE